MVTDFHSHILPGIDDGARDPGMSLAMIAESVKQGVGCIVSTSHCYPYSEEDIDRFLSERQRAFDELRDAADKAGAALPEIRLASEVHLCCDLSSLSNIGRLKIEGSGYLLLEMPMSPWSENVVEAVYKLCISGIKPIIAHMERNLMQKRELVEALCDLDVIMQVNASSFAGAGLRKEIDGMMRNGYINVVGSDMHNLDKRPPDMGSAEKNIKKRYGSECWEHLMSNAGKILSGGELDYKDLKGFSKKGILGRHR